MKRKRHAFHCEKCSNECSIYRKGKKHRVLVCPVCGVIATNPLSFRRMLSGAAKGGATGALGGPVAAGIGAAVGALTEGFSGGGDAPARTTPHTPGRRRHQDNERLRLALYG